MAEIEVQSNIKLGLKDILKAISKLETKDIERFIKEVSNLLAQKKEKEDKEKVESNLIQQIRSVYPSKLNERYQALRIKLDSEPLSEKEQAELIELTNQFELLDAQRLRYLLQLSQLRSQPLNVVLKEFSPDSYA
ncbi:MAG: hypothetical protein AAF960_17530 [Bacteroidota bacterium]